MNAAKHDAEEIVLQDFYKQTQYTITQRAAT